MVVYFWNTNVPSPIATGASDMCNEQGENLREIADRVPLTRVIRLTRKLTYERAQEAIRRLIRLERGSEEDILVILNSSGAQGKGGEAFVAGMDLYNRFSTSPNRVIGKVRRRAASAAFMALQGCKIRLAVKNSELKIHSSARVDRNPPRLEYDTTAEEYAAASIVRFALLHQFVVSEWNDMVEVLLKRSGRVNREELERLLKRDVFMSPEEALRLGFIDEIV